MKKLAFLFSMIALAFVATAQSPQAFKYQTIVRDAEGNVLPNQEVALRMSIRDASANGTILYQETFTETTNPFGLINLKIGRGVPASGTFQGINWAANSKFLEVEIDPEGGTDWFSLGTTELVSVPYAMHAETVTNVDDADADSTNELNNSIVLDGTELKVTDEGGTITTDLSSLVDDADADPTNEFQQISKAGSLVTLSDGGGSFTDQTEDADADPENELQEVTKAGSLVTLSNGGGTFTDEVEDADADPTNELQEVSKAGSLVTLSDGGGSFTDETEDADADPGNETNTSVVLDGNDLKVTDAAGTITTDLSSLVDDPDADPTNELQVVIKAGSLVTLSDGGGSFTDETEDADADPGNETNTSVVLDGNDLKVTDAAGTITADLSSLVDDPDADPENELQTLSIVGNDLSISNGNMVPLPTNMPVGTSGQTINHDGNDWAACTNLYNDGTNVGIGTTTPESKLEVAGAVRANKFVDAQNTSFYLDPADEQTSGVLKGHLGIGGAPYYSQPLIGQDGWGPNLHINTGQDTADLWIGGHLTQAEAEVGHLSFIGDWNNPIIMGDKSSKYASITGKIVSSGGQNYYPSGALIFSTATGAPFTFPQYEEPFVEQMRITHEGRLGIGTSTPMAKLDVNGSINSSEVYQIEENTVLSTPGSNTFVGMGSGESNLTGSLNTFLGYFAGNANTDGDGNTFVGRMSGANNSTGHSNTFVGDETSETNTTGSENTYIGKTAGAGCNGSGNVFLGYGAGAYETGSNKFYVANGFEDSDVLINGDFSTGNVGIGMGTTNPSEKLDVNGTVKMIGFKMPTGASNGKVLTCNSSGDGTWAALPSNTYSAGNDLVLSGTTFSLENDIDVNYVRATGSGGLGLYDDGNNGILVHDGGNVSIGSSSAWCKLDVRSSEDDRVVYAEHTGTGYNNYMAFMGYSKPANGYGVGGEFSGGNKGVVGLGGLGQSSIGATGVYGVADGNGSSKYGVYGWAKGTGINHGVFGKASGGTKNYAGYFEGDCYMSGNVGIGTTDPDSELHINQSTGGADNIAKIHIESYWNAEFAMDKGYSSADSKILFQNDGTTEWQLWHDGSEESFKLTRTGVSTPLYIDSNGDVGIKTSPATGYELDVDGDIRCVSLLETSDSRLKTNIETLSGVLNKVEHLRAVSFNWNEKAVEKGANLDTKKIGVIAQEVEAVFPELVSSGDEDNFKAVDYSGLAAMLIEAVKELKAENEALKTRIENLESK